MAATHERGQSYIIKRPRLTKLLDETQARIILLCAPAGYGKTTLAREWAENRRDPLVWQRSGPESADPTALATELAVAATKLNAPATIRTRVTEMCSRGERAEIVGRELADSMPPSEAVLIIDDYHYIEGNPEAVRICESFARHCGIRLLLTSRVRPSWLTARYEIYGTALVVGMQLLTFNDAETTTVLKTTAVCEYEGLLELAQGWPAIIGMAAVHGPESPSSRHGIQPTELFDWMASDLFEQVRPDVQRALYLLALCGDRNRDLAEELIGAEYPEYLATAASRGLLARTNDRTWGLHPLTRSFLFSRLHTRADVEEIAYMALDALVDAMRWDECLEGFLEFSVPKLFEHAFLAAVDDLLFAGRLATVTRWIELARRETPSSPLILIAEAEVALRQGHATQAQALAEQAARELREGDVAIRARLLAARAAHLRGDPDASRRLTRQAHALSDDTGTQAVALWLDLVRAVEAAEPGAATLVARLAAIDDSSPSHALRVANARAYFNLEVCGRVRDAEREVELAHGLLEHVPDALMRTNFLSFRASAAVYLAEFDRALSLCELLEYDARSTGLDFVIPHVKLHRAAAYVGLRKLGAAKKLIDEVAAAEPDGDSFVGRHVTLKRARMQLTSGNADRALLLLSGGPPPNVPQSLRGEWWGTKALLLAAQGRDAAVEDAIAAARATSSHIDATDLSDVASGITELRRHDGKATPHLLTTIGRLLENGHHEALVWAARAYPPTIRGLVEANAALKHELTVILMRSNDVAIGRAAGLEMPREFRRAQGLSVREREVYELLVQGRTNREIAQALFISESTTKVHVRHIFEKLGVHTRAEAAAAMLDD